MVHFGWDHTQVMRSKNIFSWGGSLQEVEHLEHVYQVDQGDDGENLDHAHRATLLSLKKLVIECVG